MYYVGYFFLCVASLFPRNSSVLCIAFACTLYCLLLSFFHGKLHRGYFIPQVTWILWFVYTTYVPYQLEEYGFVNMLLCLFSIAIGVFEHAKWLGQLQVVFVILLLCPAHPPAFSYGFRVLCTVLYSVDSLLLFYIHDRVERAIRWHTFPSQLMWILYTSSLAPNISLLFAVGYSALTAHTAWVRFQVDKHRPTLTSTTSSKTGPSEYIWIRVEDPLYTITNQTITRAPPSPTKPSGPVRYVDGFELLD